MKGNYGAWHTSMEGDHYVAVARTPEQALKLIRSWEGLDGQGAPPKLPAMISMSETLMEQVAVLTQDDPDVWDPLAKEFKEIQSKGYHGAVYGQDEILWPDPKPEPEPEPISEPEPVPEPEPEPVQLRPEPHLKACYQGAHVLRKKRTKSRFFGGKKPGVIGEVTWTAQITEAKTYRNYKDAKIAATHLKKSIGVSVEPLPADGVERELPTKKGHVFKEKLGPGIFQLGDGRVKIRANVWNPHARKIREKTSILPGGLGLPRYQAEKARLGSEARLSVARDHVGHASDLGESALMLLRSATESIDRLRSRARSILTLAEKTGDEQAAEDAKRVLAMFPVGTLDKRNPVNRD